MSLDYKMGMRKGQSLGEMTFEEYGKGRLGYNGEERLVRMIVYPLGETS